MIKSILNNPYRILGVYSNSPKKEQIANKGKMQAFLRVKKSMPFKLDLQGVLPDVSRTQELVDYADSELALSSGQIKHAQFWFMNKTPIDGVAFNHLIDGNIDTAMDFWRKSENLSSLQNLFVCYLIKGDYKSAIMNCAIPLYSHYAKDFVSSIDDNSNVSSDILTQTVVDTLSKDGVDLLPLSNGISNKAWKSLIEAKKADPLLSKLNTHISEAKATKDDEPLARLNAGNKLKIASKPLLQSLQNVLSVNDTRYQMIADKVAQEVLQCSIDYYNNSEDLDKPAKAKPLCEYAKSIAVGSAAKQRSEQNYEVIKEAYDTMPPVEVASEARQINELLLWYHKQPRKSSSAINLLKKAKDSLISIKEKLGKTNSYYLETSSLLGSAALVNIIDEVNNSTKEDKPNPLEGLFGVSSSFYANMFAEEERRRQKAHTIKGALHDAWEAILYIGLLDKTDDFNKNRYLPNRKSLHSLIDGVKGFDYPNDNYILTGCAHGLSVNKKFFWCDSELYAECKSKNEFKNYLLRFPNGKHADEAKRKVEELEDKEMNIWKYIGIAVAIAIALFILIIAANGNSNSSQPQIKRPEISRPHIDVFRPDVDRFYNNPNRNAYTNRSRSNYYYNDENDDDDIDLDEDIDLDDDLDLDLDNDFDIDNDF